MKRSLIMAVLVLVSIFGAFLVPGIADAQVYKVSTCADCHTYPPADAPATRGTPTGAVIGSHKEHATTYGISCTVCHGTQPTTLNHRDGNIDMTANIQGGSYSLGSPTQRNILTGATLGTCSNVACHGNGVGTFTATPQWGNTATGACGTCHGANASSPPASALHAQHVATAAGYKFACSKCHVTVAGVTTDATITSTITSTSLHVNFQHTVAFDATNTGATAYNLGSSTCSNLYCHSKGTTGNSPYSMPNTTATWLITLTCEGCHNFDKNATNKMGSGSHAAHVVTGSFGCQRCHSLTTLNGSTVTAATASFHVNKQVNVDFDTLNPAGTYGGYTSTAKGPATALQSCATTYCHGTTNTTPTWGNNNTLNCASCHSANNVLQGKHNLHYELTVTATANVAVNSSTTGSYGFGCGMCHDATLTLHAQGATNTWQAAQVAFNAAYVGAGTYSGGTTTLGSDRGFGWTAGLSPTACNNIYCHSQGTTPTAPFTAPNGTFNWSAMTLDCAGCHGGTATSTKLLTSGAHSFHLNDGVKNRAGRNFVCTDCHNATTTTGSTIADKSIHVNKQVNIKFNDGSINKNTDAPTYEGSSTTGGTGTGVIAGTGNNTCSNVYCHSVGNIDFTSKNVIAAGGASFRTPTWSAVGGLDCDNCHGDQAGKAYPVYVSGGSGTQNSHPKHIESAGHTCNVCHVATTASTTISVATMTLVPGGLHLNRTEDVAFATMATKTGVYNGANKTCSTTYCHGTGPSVAWGGTTNCGSCHTANNTLPGKHAMHYGVTTTALNFGAASSPSGTFYIFNCGVCHPSNAHATAPVSTIQTANVVFDAAIAGGGVYTASGALAGTDGSGYNWTAGTCALYCHSRGTSVTSPYPAPVVTNFNWNTASLDCAGCHGNSVGTGQLMSTNAHSSHINDGTKSKIGRNFTCRECHSATASTTTDWATSSAQYHVDKRVNIKFYNAGGLNRDAENPAYQGVLTTVAAGASVTTGVGSNQCSNVYCHSLGNMDFTTKNIITVGAYSYATPTWGGTALTCDACHGDKAGKAYPVYVSGGSGTENSHVVHVQTNGYSCNLCHVTTTVSTAITVGTMTIVPGGGHLNRVEDVAFASYWTKTGAYNGANKTCSATYCHGSGVPQWGNAAAVTCGSCHLGSSDGNDFTYNNGGFGVISQAEWTTSGHGRSTANGPYSVTNNTAANLPAAAGTGDACLYCHNDATGHGDSVNFFRLRSFASGTNGNQVCWNCHGTGSAGVNPKSGTSTTVTAVTKVDKYHYGGQHAATLSAGQFCWDCHEPHGDRASGALGPIAMIQSRPALSSDPVTGKPSSIVSTTVTFTSNNSGASYGATTAPYDKICNVCHTYNPAGQQKMVHFASNTSDGTHNTGTVCTSCHKHSSNTSKDGEAFKGGACDGCHGYPPKGGDLTPYMLVNGATPTANEGKGGWATGPTFSGGHKAHVDHLISLSGYTLAPGTDTFGSAKTAILCGTCHDMNAGNHTTDGNGTRLINFNSQQTYSFGTLPPTYKGIPGVPSSTMPKTCSNVSCHYSETPRWQDPAVLN